MSDPGYYILENEHVTTGHGGLMRPGMIKLTYRRQFFSPVMFTLTAVDMGIDRMRLSVPLRLYNTTVDLPDAEYRNTAVTPMEEIETFEAELVSRRH